MGRRIVCAGALLVLLATSAAAQGPIQRPWTGFYLGIGAGAGSVTQVQSLVDPGFGTIFSQSAGAEGFFGTVIAGYDYRVMQRIVVGGFFDYDFSRISNDTPALLPISIPFDHNHTWSIGGRLGYLAGPTTLWYLLGGYSRASFDFNVSDPFSSMISRVDFAGYFVGGGVETEIGGNWSLRGEYRFTRFHSEKILDLCGCEWIEADARMHSGRLLLIYKFGNGEAPP